MSTNSSSSPRKKQRFLIFDIETSGHHEGYMRHLLNYSIENGISIVLATDEKLINSLEADNLPEHINFEPIKKDQVEAIKKSGLFIRSIKEWQLFRKLEEKWNPESSVLMYMDTLLLGMLIGPKTISDVTGIYFRPSFHYGDNITGLVPNIMVGLKKLALKTISAAKTLDRALVLDGSAIPSLEAMMGSQKLSVCPDPVFSYSISTDELIAFRETYSFLETERKTFLIFGYLDERKGIEATIAVLKTLDEDELEQIHLVIVGSIGNDYQNKIEALLSEIQGSILITTHFKKIEGKVIQFFFEASDVVLALYQKHIGMSSVLVRAAISHKPVIADEYGLLGTLVKEKGLGLTVDSNQTSKLANPIRQVLVDDIVIDKNAQKIFVDENSVLKFGQVVLGTLNN